MLPYTFPELIDVEALQRIADSVYKAARIPIGIIGAREEIFVAAGWQRICTDFHRKNGASCARCKESDRYIKQHLFDGGFVEYKCTNGLREVGQPFMIEDTHLATIMLGQFLYEEDEADLDAFRQQAKLFGYDTEDYLKALEEVPRFTKEQVQDVLEYYEALVHTLLDSGRLKLEQLRLRKEAEVNEMRFKSFFRAMDDMVFINDGDGYYQEYISSDSSLLVVPPETFIGKTIWEVLPRTVAEKFGSAIDRLKSGDDTEEFEYPLMLGDGQHWFSAKVSQIATLASEGTSYISVVRDISDRKKNEAVIQEMAYYDGLTGLYNRTMFYRRLHEAMEDSKRRGSKTAVVFLDLDDFKRINDTKGHHIGDLLLQEIGDRLRLSVRAGDILARIGGDEFTLVIGDVQALGEVVKLVRRILEVVREPIVIDEMTLHSSASIGIAVYPDDSVDKETLIKYADLAMYDAKAKKGNRYQFYNKSIDAALHERVLLESALRSAEKNGELEVYYQPIVRDFDSSIAGFEALLRWQLADGSWLSPAEFVPVAEETGLIEPIGLWVLEEACSTNKMIQDRLGVKAVVSVNLSVVQLRSSRFVRSLKSILKRTGLPPEFLELEITESLFLGASESMTDKLATIRDLGVKLALDDFGTGYSSLSYLKKLPLDTLKVDRMFIKDICTDKRDRAILEVIIMLAHKLGLKVVAEGVETEEQRLLLTSKGADFEQGYFYYHPMPKERLIEMLKG